MASETLNPQLASTTPILDGELPVPTRSAKITLRQFLWVMGGYLLLGVATVLILLSDFQPGVKAIQALVRFLDPLIADVSSQPLAFSVRFIGRWYCVVAVHELGHVIAGFLAGFTFYWVSVGPFRVASNGNRLRLHLQKINWQGGFTVMLPCNDRNSSSRWLLMASGGALANALFAGILVFLARFSPIRFPAQPAALESLAIFSVVLVLLSLVPIRHPQFVPDGSRILMLLRNRSRAARWLAIVHLQRAFLTGQHYRDWDAETIRLATSASDKSPDDINGTLLAYTYECHRGNAEQAAVYLEHALSSTRAEAIRAVLFAEATFFQAWHRRDLQRARLWWERGMMRRKKMPAHVRLREEAAVLYIEGKWSEALEKLDQGLRAVRALPPLIEYSQLERDWLEWKEELLARQRNAQLSAHSAASI